VQQHHWGDRYAVVLAASLLTVGLSTGAVADPPTGDLTENQLNAIKMTTIARFAGSKNTCPRFHVEERAVFEEMAEGGIPPEMLDSQEFKNAQLMALMGALERQRANASDFCLAVWQLFGPHGLYRRQMLEAN
jgi:hypothetical protein